MAHQLDQGRNVDWGLLPTIEGETQDRVERCYPDCDELTLDIDTIEEGRHHGPGIRGQIQWLAFLARASPFCG
eukprot:2109867-Pyramimonas_sp.AAC.1